MMSQLTNCPLTLTWEKIIYFAHLFWKQVWKDFPGGNLFIFEGLEMRITKKMQFMVLPWR